VVAMTVVALTISMVASRCDSLSNVVVETLE
jgi:hypothetical protein